MDILTYINRMNQIYGNEPAPVRYNTQQYLQGGRVGYKPGGIVEPGVTHYGRPSKKGSNFYYRESTDEWIAYSRKPGDTSGKKYVHPFKKKSDALKFLKEGEKRQLLAFEKTRSIRTKEVNKAYNNINSWTKKWLNKNMPEYTAKEISKFEKDFAKAWAKELKTNSSLYPKFKGIRFDFSTKTNLPWARELKLSGLTSPVDKTSDTFFKKVFYKEKLKNPEFKKNVKNYFEWVVADKKLKTTKAKYAGLETPGTAAGRLKHLETAKINQFDDDVIHLISEMQKGDPSRIYSSLKEQFPDLLKKYSYKVSLGTTQWRENLRVVAKNAGLDSDVLYKQMRNENAKVAKILGINVDKVPNELRYAIDHVAGLAEAANYTGTNKAAFSRKTLNTLVARTREQNDILGRQTLSIPRSKLIRKFNKVKTLDDKVKIVGEINELVEKHIPGEIKYKVTGSGNLDFKASAPQKTIKARVAAYKNIPEVKKNIANILSNSGIKCALANGINCSDPRAYVKSINELKAKAALGDEAAFTKFRKVANTMRKFKGPLAFTGWGILGEIGFALPFAAMDYADGKSTAQIMNNASMGLFGMNEEEEAISYLPKGSLGGAIPSAMRAGERIEKLEDPKRIFPQSRMGMDENRFQKAQAKVIPDAKLDLIDKVAPFLEGPRNEYYNQEKAAKAYNELEIAKAKLAADELQRAKERAVTPFEGIEFKEGGRVSFKGGGIDKGKRAFMKLLAAFGIGTATVGTGLIKLGGKAVGKKAAVKSGVDIATGTPGMPDWFPSLVNKIIKEGDDVTKKLATKEREIVHTKKIDTGSASPDEVTIYRDLDTGDIRVEVDSVSNMGQAPIQLDYKAPSVIDSGKKTNPKFSAVETEPRVTTWEGDIEFDGENIVGNIDDLFSDTTKVKNYAKGEKSTMKDIVTRKKKTDKVKKINEDTMEQLDYIENKEGMAIDDFIDESARVGQFETKSGSFSKGINLPDKKIKKASGGLASYDDYLPGIDDID